MTSALPTSTWSAARATAGWVADRAALRAAAVAKSERSRPRFLHNVRGDIRRHGRLLTRSVLGLLVYRFGAWALGKPRWLRYLAMKCYGPADRVMRVVTGLHMQCTVHVGDDLHLIHCEGPISIHPEVILGDRVGIMHNVTIGLATDSNEAPILGNDVF